EPPAQGRSEAAPASVRNPEVVQLGVRQGQRARAALILLEERARESPARSRERESAIRQARDPEAARGGYRETARDHAPLQREVEGQRLNRAFRKLLRLGFFLLPGAPGGFDDQSLLDGAGRDAHVTHLAVRQNRLDPLK